MKVQPLSDFLKNSTKTTDLFDIVYGKDRNLFTLNDEEVQNYINNDQYKYNQLTALTDSFTFLNLANGVELLFLTAVETKNYYLDSLASDFNNNNFFFLVLYEYNKDGSVKERRNIETSVLGYKYMNNSNGIVKKVLALAVL